MAHQYSDGRRVGATEKTSLYCYVAVPENPVGQRLGIVSWGRMGYRFSGTQRVDHAGADVDRMAAEANAMLKIGVARAKDMVARSIVGWRHEVRGGGAGIEDASAFLAVSAGHLAFIGKFEYFCGAGHLWRAPWRERVGDERVRMGIRLMEVSEGLKKWDLIEVAKAEHLRLASSGKGARVPESVCIEGGRNEA